MDMERTVIAEKEYKIQPFGHLVCGDPCYLNDEIGKDFTIDETLYSGSTRKAGLIIQQVQYDGISDFSHEPTSFQTVNVIAYNIPKGVEGQRYVDAQKEGKYIPDDVKQKVELGCDTASFDLSVDNRDVHIDTGADGYYGSYLRYTHNRAYILELELDPSYIGLDRIKADMGYVFDCKELLKKEVGIDDKKKPDVERE